MGPGNSIRLGTEACLRLLNQFSARINTSLELSDAESVHQLRVSIRRLSQALRSFDGCLDAHTAEKLRQRLKKTMRLAGEVRNLDIAMECLHRWKIRDQDKLLERRAAAACELQESLRRWVQRGWIGRCIERLSRHLDHPEEATREGRARNLLSSMAADFFLHGRAASAVDSTAPEMHAFRIAAKKFRYTMELFVPDYGPVLSARVEKVRKVQSILGEVNDCETMLGLLTGGRAVSRLRKRQRQMIGEFRQLWEAEWADAAVMRMWVDDLGLLSQRKGPQREPACRRASGPQNNRSLAATAR